jgi:uncharacterized protein YecE (DUF72 family)
VKTLDEFVRRWPRELRISFEFRHPSWFTDDVYEILRRRGASFCLAERDEMTTPEILTADFVYLRLRKSSYSHAALRKLADRIKRLAQYRDVFAFFRQDGDQGPLYAQEISRKLRVKL